MVRELSIHFIHAKKGHIEENSEKELEHALAFALGQSSGIDDATLTKLGRVGIPFWIVQVSNKNSIVVSPFHNGGHEFNLSKVTGLNTVIRKLRSEVDEPHDIPKIVPDLVEHLRQIESEPKQINFIESPHVFENNGKWVSVTDPNRQPLRVKPYVDSRKALDISEEFQNLKETASLKVQKMEGVQKLVAENVGSIIEKLKNRIQTEKRRWSKRIADKEESNKEVKQQVENERDKKLYDLKERHTIGLRAIVSEFSRETDQLKIYYEKQMGLVDNSRIEIQQEPANVERAIDIVDDLAVFLKDEQEDLSRILQDIKAKSKETQKSWNEAESAYKTKKEEIQKDAEKRIENLNDKLTALKHERDSEISALESLLEKCLNNLSDLEQEIEDLIIHLQNDLIEIEDFQLPSNSIEGLAPLSRLDIVCFIARYSKGADVLLSPCFLPESEFDGSISHEPISTEFHDLLLRNFKLWDKEGREFEANLNQAVVDSDILDNEDKIKVVQDGFHRMQRMQLLSQDQKDIFLEELSNEE